ncbi:anthranilate synthase component II [Mangrovibacillus cuniculi]|uniref:Aminodeoxychorismate/anthranilate synthase component II n=1 Tax=Mangrovibacillus cuniculi TaxID=2593652 RepID=A0A7S8CAT5_9BACI|nr:aminodeoxychorismate/anthranilate synthase component II [Mangrovibacillus cuniculi]QPC46577.1 aminodeoxychorismate/anthranilate synthase component II [Mangrovibacillus cuniculi]
MILLIDHYDSFTFNVANMFKQYGEVKVVRHDEITLEDIKKLNPSAIVLSPGPGKPSDVPNSKRIVREFYRQTPIMGICLGHQLIMEEFGGMVEKTNAIKHGKTSMIMHTGKGIFSYLSNPLKVMRYHSLVANKEMIPEEFDLLATSMDDGHIMAVQHKDARLVGLQFHPESIGTKEGKEIVASFMSLVPVKECV